MIANKGFHLQTCYSYIEENSVWNIACCQYSTQRFPKCIRLIFILLLPGGRCRYLLPVQKITEKLKIYHTNTCNKIPNVNDGRRSERWTHFSSCIRYSSSKIFRLSFCVDVREEHCISSIVYPMVYPLSMFMNEHHPHSIDTSTVAVGLFLLND